MKDLAAKSITALRRLGVGDCNFLGTKPGMRQSMRGFTHLLIQESPP